MFFYLAKRMVYGSLYIITYYFKYLFITTEVFESLGRIQLTETKTLEYIRL